MLAKLLVIHYVADFLLQPREMGKKKSSEPKWLAGHLLIQFLCFLPFAGWLFALLNCAVHGIIDWYIWRAYKYSVLKRFPDAGVDYKYYEDHLFYSTIGFDQLLHGLTLFYLAGYLL